MGNRLKNKREPKLLRQGRGLPKLIVDEIAYRVLRAIHKRALRRPDGMPSMCVSSGDLITHRLIATGIFEASQIEAIDAIVERRLALLDRNREKLDLFLDVGANIGIYSARYAASFNRTLAIEANPITFKLLSANLTIGNCDNTLPLCVAASAHQGTAKIAVRRDGNLGWSSLERHSRDKDAEQFEIDVAMETLDRIVENNASGSRVDMIKLDVEGHEASVLEGARRLLQRDKPVVLYERSFLADGRRVDEILRECGYCRFAVFKRRLSPRSLFLGSELVMTEYSANDVPDAALVCAY